MSEQKRNVFYQQCAEIYGEENAYVSSLIIEDIYNFFQNYEQFKLLFLKNKENNYYELMAHIAPNFFYQVYRSWLWTLTVDFCNLVEEKKDKKGNKNISIEWLIEYMSDKPKQTELKSQIENLREKGSIWYNIKQHRNKLISHRDYDVALGNKELPKVLREEIDEGFDQLAKLVEKTGFSIVYNAEKRNEYFSEKLKLNNWIIPKLDEKLLNAYKVSDEILKLMQYLQVGYSKQ